MPVRKPSVAGQFYPSDKKELLSSIRKSFTSKFGPGALPGKRGKAKLHGAITPHAGYTFSGAGAAHVYKEIAESGFPDTYVIIGVNHSGPQTCSSSDDWETPLGVVKCDTEMVRLMYKKGLQLNSKAHKYEHSIEVQLPFLQFASSDRSADLRIVPVMIADEQFEKWGRIIKESAKELDRKIIIICSSDFTHYGHGYGYLPFYDDVPAKMKKLDEDAIFFITKPNPSSFFDYTEKTGATICGRYGICTLLWLMKYLDEEKKGTLLKYYTSGDVVSDYSNTVGYAAIVFR